MKTNLLPVPENEAERIQVIDMAGLLYSAEEEEFQALVQAIADICEVKMALVTVVHSNVQWFKAKIGIDIPETPRDISFCQHAIMSQEMMEINDTLLDERFVANPFVTGAPHIRFYAGQPIVVNGHALGTLCVLDDQPRQLDARQREALRFFGIRISELVENRKVKMEAMKAEK